MPSKSTVKTTKTTLKKDKKVTEKKKTAPVAEADLSMKIYDLLGVEGETVTLSSKIFGAKVSKTLLTQYVRVYTTNQRQGNASTKMRSEIVGSTRKIYRQKGTGKARHGAASAPIFVGGGVQGGPKPKNFELKMNKKQKRAALFGSLSAQYKEGNILGITNSLSTIEPKTKNAVSALKSLLPNEEKALIVLPQLENNNLNLAVRNLQYIEVVDVRSINPYIVLNHKKIIFIKDALQVLEDHFLKTNAA